MVIKQYETELWQHSSTKGCKKTIQFQRYWRKIKVDLSVRLWAAILWRQLFLYLSDHFSFVMEWCTVFLNLILQNNDKMCTQDTPNIQPWKSWNVIMDTYGEHTQRSLWIPWNYLLQNLEKCVYHRDRKCLGVHDNRYVH